MTRPRSTRSQPRPHLLTFRSGGWVILLATVLVLTIVIWHLVAVLNTPHTAAIGDGRHVETYAFDLSTCLVPREQLVAAGFPKDGLPTFSNPQALTLAAAEKLDREMRGSHIGKFMVGKERVVGVALNGQSRAYALKILTWHEVVNDTLAGVPIAVTYNPLCDSVVVFDRRAAGQVLEFGVSGLLYNSNLLMYDRRPDGAGESLWSQLQFRAIAGPAAACGTTLRVLPCAVLPWSQWQKQHPATTVLAPDPACTKLYKRTYAEYFGSDRLRFPVAPLPPHDIHYKTPLIAVQVDNAWHHFLLPDLATRVDETGQWQTTLSGRPVTFHYVAEPATAWVTADVDAPPPVAYSFWFAWYACTTARP